LRRDLADATQAIAEAVQDVGDGAGGGNRLVGPRGVGDQLVVNGGGGDAGVAERGVELGVGLRVGFQQGMDLPGHLRVIVFGLVPSAGGEIIETADAGAEFAQSGRNGVATPTEDLFGAAWLASAVLEGHLGLELAAAKARQFAGGREDDVLDGGGQVESHDRVLVCEGTTSKTLAVSKEYDSPRSTGRSFPTGCLTP